MRLGVGFRQTINAGHLDAAPRAAVLCSVLLKKQGQPEPAAAVYLQAIDSEHPDEACPLADPLAGTPPLPRSGLPASVIVVPVRPAGEKAR